MKNFLPVVLLAGVCFISNAQKTAVVAPYTVPVDSITKLITYEAVIEVKGVTADVLYKRINDWFHTFYVNPVEVIRENDSLKFSITGKPRFRVNNPPDKDGTKKEGPIIQYTITVAARESRFKYELTAYNMKTLSYFPCEKWLDTKATSYVPVYNDYLQQLDKYTLDLISSLKNAVTKEKTVKDKDKW